VDDTSKDFTRIARDIGKKEFLVKDRGDD